MKRLLLLVALLLVATPAHAQDWLMQMARQFYTIRVGPQVMIGPATSISTAADSGNGSYMDTRYARNLLMYYKVYRTAGATFASDSTGTQMVRLYVTAKGSFNGATDTTSAMPLYPRRHFALTTSTAASDTISVGWKSGALAASNGATPGPFEFALDFSLNRTGNGGGAFYWADFFSGPPPPNTQFVVRKGFGQTCLVTLTVEGCP